MCFWMFDCNQCVLERLFQKTACLVWKFGCGSAHALVSQPQMGRRGACLHLPQECMTYMNMVGGATVEWCIIATDLHCLTWGGVDVNKKTEKYLLNGSSAVEEIISSEETQSGLLWINEGWNHLIRETEKQSCSEVWYEYVSHQN